MSRLARDVQRQRHNLFSSLLFTSPDAQALLRDVNTMIHIEFPPRDHSLLERSLSRWDRVWPEFRLMKALRHTAVCNVRFSNPRRCGNDRGLLMWRLSDRKSRQRQRLEQLIFDDSEAPDLGFPRQRLRYGVRRRLRRASARDARRFASCRPLRAGLRRVHQRRR